MERRELTTVPTERMRVRSATGSAQASARASRGWRCVAPLLLLLCGLLIGCAPARGLELSDWTLHSQTVGSRGVQLPAHFEELLPDERSKYQLTRQVVLPDDLRDEKLTLFIPYATAVMTLRVNGVEVPPADPLPRRAYRALGTYEWVLPETLTRAGELSLELEARHEWMQSGWLDTTPRIVPSEEGDLQTDVVRVINELTAGFGLSAFILLGFTYLGIYFGDRRRVVHLWFAVSALTASGYHLWVLGYAQWVFGRYDIAFLCISMAACVSGSVFFTHAHFNLPRPSRLWDLFFFGVVALALLGPDVSEAQSMAVPVTAMGVFWVMIYQLRLCLRLARLDEPPRGTYIVMASWITLGLLDIHESLFWLGFGDHLGGIRGACPGLMMYAVLQSLLLSREHIFSLERSDELNVQLASRVEMLETRQAEIQQLNEELRRQVHSRSRQLAEALAGAATGTIRMPVVGDVLQERYRVLREIGSGGMGAVFEVVRETDDRRLALKVTSGGGAISLARLAREAQVATQVTHPHVVSIVDVDVAADGALYLLMEYVDGPPLSEMRPRYGDIPWAITILRQIVSGLCALHGQGIVHRDLKPANILVTEDDGKPHVKITDFGISRLESTEELPSHELNPSSHPTPRDGGAVDARSEKNTSEVNCIATVPIHVDVGGSDDATRAERQQPEGSSPSSDRRSSPRLTQAGCLVGTPPYMPPEGIVASLVGPATDIFAFGVIAYELLSGARPFEHPPALCLLEGKKVPPAKPLRSLLRGPLDATLVEQIVRCISFDITQRPTAQELHLLFEKLRAREVA